MDVFQLMGRVAVDITDAERSLEDINSKASSSGSKLGKVFGAIGKGAVSLGKTITVGMAKGTVAMAGLAAGALNSTAQLEQNLGGSEAVFKDFAETIQGVSKTAFKDMGLSQSEFLATANKMGALFQGSGFGIEESANLSAAAMQRAADVASIMGIDTSAAMEAVAGAAKGNFTMMDNLGVAMNETSLNAYVLSKGIEKSTSEMTQQEKTALAMEMFLEKTSYAAGNYAKENETLAGALGTAKSALQNFITGTATTEDVVSALSNAGNVLVSNIKTLLPNLISGANDLVKALIPLVPPLLAELMPAVVDGVVIIVNSIIDVLPMFIDELINSLPMILDGLQEIIDAIINALPALAQSIFDILPTLIPKLVTMLISSTATLLQYMPQIITPLLENLPQLIMGIIDAVVSNLPLLINGCVQLVVGIVDALPEIISGLIDMLPYIIQSIVAGLFAALPELIAGVIEMLGSVGSAIGETITGICSKVWGIVKTIFAPVGDFFGGIWGGIKNAFGSVADWFKDVFSKAWQAVKNVFSSGGEVFAGIKDGIVDAFKAVVNAIITGINKVIAIPFKAINAVLKKLKNISILGVEPFGWVSTFDVPEIPKLRKGGTVKEGQLFIANEDQPELIGSSGGNTTVVNNEQIIAAVVAGVAKAVNTAIARVIDVIENNIPSSQAVAAEGDITIPIYLDGGILDEVFISAKDRINFRSGGKADA